MDMITPLNVLCAIVDFVANKMEPKKSLKFLLNLEQHLFFLTGKIACDYGGGIHPKHRHTKYHDFFCNRIDKSEQVVDVGCGIGFLAHDIAEKSGAHVYGIDISRENIKTARKKFSHERVKYVVGDALKDLPEGKYDTVVLSNVLEHIEHRVSFLKGIVEKIRPTRILIRVPLYERDWRVPLMEEVGVDYRLDSTHFTEYTQESFEEEMREAGLKITHKEIRWGEIWCEVRR
jgi:2-polyprenyl-3-methyl-5-hydroxy-6-metoxy-1,4-benzoquinol methylase